MTAPDNGGEDDPGDHDPSPIDTGMPDRGVGVTRPVYEGLLSLAERRDHSQHLDERYPDDPRAATTVLLEHGHDSAAGWVRAYPERYRRGRLEGFYVEGDHDGPTDTPNTDYHRDAPVTDTPSGGVTTDADVNDDIAGDDGVRDGPWTRSDLLAEFLSAPEEWHAMTAGVAIGYAVYTPNEALLAFALMLVGLDMASTVKWQGNDQLKRELRAEYPYAVLGAALGAVAGLAHLSMTGGDAVIADFVTDMVDSSTDAGMGLVPMAVLAGAIFLGAVIATVLTMVALKLAGLVP